MRVPILYNGPPFLLPKLPLRMGYVWSNSNTWFRHLRLLVLVPLDTPHMIMTAHTVKRKCVDSKFWVETQLPLVFERRNN